MTAPPAGPNVTAANATGITFNVIASGPIFRYPSGVYAMRRRTAVSRPSIVSCLVFIFLFMERDTPFLFVIILPEWNFMRKIHYKDTIRGHHSIFKSGRQFIL